MKRATTAALLLALSAALFFWRLGNIPFYDKGEPREALQVWEEVHGGEWILPLRNGNELPSKPPLFHWLAGLVGLATGGVNEFVVRCPSALTATLAVLVVFWYAARRWGAAAGIYAGATLATSFEWLRAARLARVDMTHAACLTVTLAAFGVIATAPRPPLAALAVFYVFAGLAALAKGPVGLLLPALIAFGFLLIRRDLSRIRSMRPLLGGFIALTIAALWYAMAIHQGGAAFVHKQLLGENVLRFLGTKSGSGSHVKPYHYYLPSFLGGFAPWTLLLGPLTVHLVRQRRRLHDQGYLYPIVWWVVVVGFYSLSAGKRAVYILAAYPAAALLLGAWWSRLRDGETDSSPRLMRLLGIVAWTAVAAAVALLGVLCAEALGLQPLAALGPLLHSTDRENLAAIQKIAGAHPVVLVTSAVALTALTLLFGSALRHRRWRSAFAALVLSVASGGVIQSTVLERLAAQRTYKPFVARLRRHVSNANRLYFYNTFDYGALFYAHRHIPVLHDRLPQPMAAGGTYLLLSETEWKRMEPARRRRLEFADRSRGSGPKGRERLVLARLRPSISP